MTTLRARSLVSLAATLAVAVALGGCASAPSPLAWDEAAPAGAMPVAVRFDNEARDYVHVYLVSPQRQWLLGRVEPGARAMLVVPEAALAEDAGPMQLAVVAGGRVTQRVAGESRATIAIEQPAAEIASQRWTFSQQPVTGQVAAGQLTALRLAPARREIDRQ